MIYRTRAEGRGQRAEVPRGPKPASFPLPLAPRPYPSPPPLPSALCPLTSRGFTLVEALVAAALVAGLAVAVGTLFRAGFSLRQTIDASLTIGHDARSLLRPFADEVRSAGAGADGSFPLAETVTFYFTFFSD